MSARRHVPISDFLEQLITSKEDQLETLEQTKLFADAFMSSRVGNVMLLQLSHELEGNPVTMWQCGMAKVRKLSMHGLTRHGASLDPC